MDLQEKFNILLTKFNLGKFDEVIFEATLMSKKYPAQEVFINLLSLSYQAKGEFNNSILILEKTLKKYYLDAKWGVGLDQGYLGRFEAGPRELWQLPKIQKNVKKT